MSYDPVGPRDRLMRRTCVYCGFGWAHSWGCPLSREKRALVRWFGLLGFGMLLLLLTLWMTL